MELFRTNKISPAFEPMKVDDLIETVNHFACVRMVVDNIQEPLSVDLIRQLHHMLYYGTYADRKQRILRQIETKYTKEYIMKVVIECDCGNNAIILAQANKYTQFRDWA